MSGQPPPSVGDVVQDADIAETEFRRAFEEKLEEISAGLASNARLLSKTKYDEIVSVLKTCDESSNSKTKRNRWLKTYSLLTYMGQTKLVYKKHIGDDTAVTAVPRLVFKEEFFDILLPAHQRIGHGKGRSFYTEGTSSFSNASRQVTDLFCKMCPRCATRAPLKPPAREGHRPILTHGFGYRLQIDCIDMQSCPGDEVDTVSPTRKRLRDAAALSQERQASRMQRQAARAGGATPLQVGDLFHVGVADVDRGKLSNPTLMCVVVEITDAGSYRLATRAGVLPTTYFRGDLMKYKGGVSLNAFGLDKVLKQWKTMEKVCVRAAHGQTSVSGMQGMSKCSCIGKCDTQRCSCVKAGRKCNSRCHPRSTRCENLCC